MNFRQWLEAIEPWKERGVGKHPWFPDAPVRWIHISKIKPVHGRNPRPPKPINPNKPYEPLVINREDKLQDGYHRYFDLLDAGFDGEVPVVVADI